MKPVVSKQKIITIIIFSMILGIAGGILINVIVFPPIDTFSRILPGGDERHSHDNKITDISLEVEEYNISIVHNMTIIPVTYDELSVFPDLEKAMHGVTNDPVTWRYGHRVVKWFTGNESDLHGFFLAVCKNKTWDECYPNSPLFEYHGQYYSIFYDRIGSHSVGGCERGNYNCTGSERHNNTSIFILPPAIRGDQYSFTTSIPAETVPEARIWVLGDQYLTIDPLPKANNSNVNLAFDTARFQSGQYYILIQIPDPESGYDIALDSRSEKIRNSKKAGNLTNNRDTPVIFTLDEARAMNASDLQKALLKEFRSQGVGDKVFVYSLNVTNPFITIYPIRKHSPGESITIKGTTNFLPNFLLLVQGRPLEDPMNSTASFSRIAMVVTGDDSNLWSVTQDSSQFAVGRYVITVRPVNTTYSYNREAVFTMTPLRQAMM
ncbi:MAG: hypothetical protein WC586_01765 [Methanoregula sp.]